MFIYPYAPSLYNCLMFVYMLVFSNSFRKWIKNKIQITYEAPFFKIQNNVFGQHQNICYIVSWPKSIFDL